MAFVLRSGLLKHLNLKKGGGGKGRKKSNGSGRAAGIPPDFLYRLHCKGKGEEEGKGERAEEERPWKSAIDHFVPSQPPLYFFKKKKGEEKEGKGGRNVRRPLAIGNALIFLSPKERGGKKKGKKEEGGGQACERRTLLRSYNLGGKKKKEKERRKEVGGKNTAIVAQRVSFFQLW